MRYSLASRFQGALIGATIGESVVSIEKALVGSQTMVSSVEGLIEPGRLDVGVWYKNLQTQTSFHVENRIATLIAALPIMLFFHENIIKLRQTIQQIVKLQQDDPVLRDCLLAISYVIVQSLTEQLQPQIVIPQTVSFLAETTTSLPQQLLKVNDFLEKGAGLRYTQAQLSREDKMINIIALSLYCFLDSLEDFRLSMLRASQIHDSSSTIGIIVGALSGVYNGLAGIPATWQVKLSYIKSPKEEINSFSQMLELADALTTRWSGVYHLAPIFSQTEEKDLAVAAPYVIR